MLRLDWMVGKPRTPLALAVMTLEVADLQVRLRQRN